MRIKKRTMKAIVAAITVLLFGAGTSPVLAQGGLVPGQPDIHDIFVSDFGSFDATGSDDRPFQSLHSAITRTETWAASSELWFFPGEFPEFRNITISTPCTLNAITGGHVDIGLPANIDENIVSIMTANVHLFGNQFLPLCPACFPIWRDWVRAHEVAEYVGLWSADVICLQEVWDPQLVLAIASVLEQYGYDHHFYGGAWEDGSNCLNSGLLVVSKHPLHGWAQGFFDAESGFDEEGGASKGWIRGEVLLADGPPIGVFVTHTEADVEDWDIRAEQLSQLRNDVVLWRTDHPGRPIFVVGDFNVASETSGTPTNEYATSMSPIMRSAGLRDAHRNGQHYYAVKENHPYPPYTAEHSNPVYSFFNPGLPNELLDYILYTGNTQTLPYARPRGYTRVVRLKRPTAVSDWGDPNGSLFSPCTGDVLTSDMLSDHHGLWMQFTLYSQSAGAGK